MSLLDGLAAYWKFAEGTGTSAADATGNGNTGTLVGTVSWVSGFVSGEGAVHTDSGTNYVSLTGAPVASLSQPFSVLLHVNSASVTATQTIFSEGSSSSDNPVFALLVPNTPTGKMRVLFRNNGGSSLIDKNGSIAVFDGNNHTILFRYDGSGNYETFIDGVKDTSLSGTFTPSGVLTLNRSAFGALARTSYTFPCPGNYGSAGRWTRRLDDDEAAALYNSGAGLSYDDFGGGGGTPITVEALSGSLAVTGQTGSVSTTANKTVKASSGSLSIIGQTGHVSANANVSVEATAGSLAISGSQGAVSVTANQNVRASSGSISLSGQTPTVSVTANVTVRTQSGSMRLFGSGCHVRVTSSASVEANSGTLSVRGQVANVSIRSKSRGDDAGPRYSEWAPGIRPIRVIYEEKDVREALGEPKAETVKPTKAKKRKLVKNVEQKVLSASSLPAMFTPVVERAVSQEIGMAWKGPSDWEVLSVILNVAVQRAVEEIQRIQREIEDEDEMILLLAA